MKNPKRLIGKKVRGFKFGLNHTCGYSEYMNKFIGVEGIVEYYREYNKTFGIRFDEEPDTWLYPADQIEAHLVDDEEGVKEEIKQALSKNKVLICNSDLKIEDEIPTLSDGVMMLVSDDEKVWYKRKVIGQKNNYFYSYGEVSKSDIICWKYAKPIEPTKEEQLTAILGSSEKVSEIMELFKN